MKRRRAVGGPEAELSGEEDDDEDEKGEEQEGEAGEEDTSEEEKEEVVVVLGGSEERKKNTLVPVSVPVPVREVSMGALLDGAKLKPGKSDFSFLLVSLHHLLCPLFRHYKRVRTSISWRSSLPLPPLHLSTTSPLLAKELFPS